MIPVIKKNKPRIAFKQWLSEKYPIERVTPVEFIGFKYRVTSIRKPTVYFHNGETFIGEIWKCYDKDGNWMECIFKHYIDKAINVNSSLTINRNPIEDGWQPNLLLDSYKEYQENTVTRTKNPNRLLSIQNRKHKERIRRLREVIVNGKAIEQIIAFNLLRHKESPTIATLRAVQKNRRENSDIYEEIIKKINYE